MKKATILFFICFLLLNMEACGTQENLPVKVTEKVMRFEPLSEIKDGRPNIYLILKLIDSNYWQVIIEGVRDASNICECNVYYAGTYNETDWESQRVLIDNAYKNGADGIILSPNDSIMLSSQLEEIHEEGIPIVLVDTIVNNDVFDMCYMTDNFIAGTTASEEMISLLKENGHGDNEELEIGVMVGSKTSQTINERLAGFFQHWAENAPQNWRIISDIKNCNGDIEEAFNLAKELMFEHEKLSGLYGTNNGPTRALCSTVMDSNREDIVVVGFDYSDEMKTMIELPEFVAATMLQKQYDMGYKALETITEILNGNTAQIKYVDTGVIAVKYENLSDSDVVETLKHN